MKKRVLTWLMTAVMLVSLFPLPAFAAETEMYTGGLCPHHPQHTEECGYIEGVEGQPCGYVCQECFANEQRPEQTNLQWVQAMIGALPDAENITPDNRAGVEAQLDTIGATWAELSDEEAEQLDVVRCLAAQDALAALDGQENNGLPTALAAEDDVSYRYCDANGQNWQTGTKSSGDYTAVTADATAWTSGWYVASGTVSIGQRVTVTGDVHLILTDGCSLTVNGGINVNESNAITIYAQSTGENMGRLTATDSVACAGIGGNLGQKGGTITINGGFVTAIGGIDGAGIGGGQYSAGGIITINGGTVNATGGRYHNYGTGGGAGIGGGGGYGSGCFKGTVTITGGTVTAASSGGVAGIAGNPFSTGTDGNALIVASDISTENSNENEWGAVIFKGNEGKVYGSPTLKEDATIPSGKTLTIESGQTLTIGSGVTLTNNGAIKNNGTLTNNGTINGNGEYSGSGTVNKASPTAPNNGEGYTIDYTAETITANSGYEVSSDQSNTLEDDSTINPSGTLYVRKSGNNFCNASGWTSFTVANRPSAPTLSIDNDTESVTISSGYYYNTTGGDYANTWTQGIGSAVTVAPGASIYICIPATNSTFRSAVQTLEAPARASTPIGLQGVNTSFAGENDGEITGVSTAMEYKLSTADSWTVCPDTKITNLSAGKYQVRVKATTSTYASEATDVTIASGAEKTYTLNVTDITFDTATYGYTQPDAKAITITSIGNSAATIFSVTVSGSDFTISGSNKTVTAGGKLESYIVQPNVGLSAGTHTATITVTYDNNATAEATVSFTVNGAAQTAPAAPELDSKTYNSVTLKTVADNGNGAKAQYSSDNGTTWQASREFTGLSPSTKYSFVVRYGASGNYEASPVSSALEVTTEAAPVATYLVTVNGGTGGRSYAAGDTVTITATVPNGQRFTGWTVNTGGVTVPNTNPASRTFLRMIERLPTYDAERGDVEPWLFRVAERILIDYYREKRPALSLDGGLPETPSISFEEEYQKIMDPRRKALYRALTRLPERDRVLLYRKYLLEESYHQIAGELHMNESTLASALLRAKEKLKRQLERDGLGDMT